MGIAGYSAKRIENTMGALKNGMKISTQAKEPERDSNHAPALSLKPPQQIVLFVL